MDERCLTIRDQNSTNIKLLRGGKKQICLDFYEADAAPVSLQKHAEICLRKEYNQRYKKHSIDERHSNGLSSTNDKNRWLAKDSRSYREHSSKNHERTSSYVEDSSGCSMEEDHSENERRFKDNAEPKFGRSKNRNISRKSRNDNDDVIDSFRETYNKDHHGQRNEIFMTRSKNFEPSSLRQSNLTDKFPCRRSADEKISISYPTYPCRCETRRGRKKQSDGFRSLPLYLEGQRKHDSHERSSSPLSNDDFFKDYSDVCLTSSLPFLNLPYGKEITIVRNTVAGLEIEKGIFKFSSHESSCIQLKAPNRKFRESSPRICSNNRTELWVENQRSLQRNFVVF